jgi:hypothetical protein
LPRLCHKEELRSYERSKRSIIDLNDTKPTMAIDKSVASCSMKGRQAGIFSAVFNDPQFNGWRIF